jgi:hypothetical protein
VAVDDLLEQVEDPDDLEDLATVRRRRNHGAVQPCVARGAHVGHRAVVGLDPLAHDELLDELVLAVAEPVDLGVVDRDAARLQEVAHPVVARQAVDVLVVVHVAERRVGAAALVEVLVEELLPRLRVHDGRLGQHAVEVEEAGADLIREAEHLPNVPGRDARPVKPGADQAVAPAVSGSPAALQSSLPSTYLRTSE